MDNSYQFGIEQGEYYFVYFASHRMTNDTLNRIFANGRTELLGYCEELYVEGDKQAERDYHKHNRKFYEDVKRRGLW